MSRRATLYLSYLALFVACVYGAGCEGCSGTPSSFNQVSTSTTTPTILQGGTAVISAVVANDTSGDGVSWTLAGVGTLSGATKTSVTYNAPSTVAAATVVNIKATSVSFPSSSNTIAITVEPALAITTTTLPATNAGASYNAPVNAVGGVPPFTWSVSAGALTSQLALSASTTQTVNITGTPLTQTTDNFTLQVKDSLGNIGTQPLSIAIGAPLSLQVTTTTLPIGNVNQAYPSTVLQAAGGIPPFTWTLTTNPLTTFPPGLALASNGTISGTPTTSGAYTFGVMVTDSETPAMTATASLTLAVDDLAAFNGNFAFALNGFDASGNAVAMAGSFTADGAGNLTAGVEDVSSMVAASKNQTFTGTYTLDDTNQGVLTFSSLAGSPAFSFALNAAATQGRIIEFDSTGVRGSGVLAMRTTSTCSGSTFSGAYAFGLTGHEAPVTGLAIPGPASIIGSFTATAATGSATVGNIGSAEVDANIPAKITAQDKILSGTFQASSQGTRCTMTLTSTLPTMDFSVYPISTYAAFLVETDTVNTTTPLLMAGTMQQQTGNPFSSASGSSFSSGVTSVAALTGSYYNSTTTAFVPDVALLSITGSGASSFSIAGTENRAGTVLTTSPTGSNFIQADQFGRVASNQAAPFDLVFYMISQNTAYAIADTTANGQPDPFFGIFQPQSGGPFVALTIESVFVEGTGIPTAASVPDISGLAAFEHKSTTGGAFGALQNQSTAGGNVSGVNPQGTFSGIDPVTGAGSLSLTSPVALTGSFVIVSPSQVLMITTTSGDTNPVVILFQQ